MSSGLLVSVIFYYVNDKKLNENQKDPKLHYFIFDHFLFRWLPNSFRKWARFGLINPEFETVRDTRTEKYKNIDSNLTSTWSPGFSSPWSMDPWIRRRWERPWGKGSTLSWRWSWRKSWSRICRRKSWVIRRRQWYNISIKRHFEKGFFFRFFKG